MVSLGATLRQRRRQHCSADKLAMPVLTRVGCCSPKDSIVVLKELVLKVLEVAVLEVAVVAVVVAGERIGNAAVQEVQDTLQVHVWMCLTSLQCLRVGLSHYHHPLLLVVLLVTNATETVLLFDDNTSSQQILPRAVYYDHKDGVEPLYEVRGRVWVNRPTPFCLRPQYLSGLKKSICKRESGFTSR